MLKADKKKDDRLNLRISSGLKQEVQHYCEARGIDVSDLVTRFFLRVVANERTRKGGTG